MKVGEAMNLKKYMFILGFSVCVFTACNKDTPTSTTTIDMERAEAMAQNLKQAIAEQESVNENENDHLDVFDLSGTWLMVGGEVEGDAWNAIPGNFEILVFTPGLNPIDNTETLFVDLESRDIQGFLNKSFYQLMIEPIDQPIYEGCGNEEWSVRIGDESEIDSNGNLINEEYYVTLLDENTLLKQHFFTIDGGPGVSYQTFKRIFPVDGIVGCEIREDDIPHEWVLDTYIDENGNPIPLPKELTNFTINLSGTCSWSDLQRNIDFEYPIIHWFGKGGTVLFMTEDGSYAWFAGALGERLSDDTNDSDYTLRLYHDGGWLNLKEKETPAIPILDAMITTLSREEHLGDQLICSAIRDSIRLSDEDAEQYPALANALESLTGDSIENMESSMIQMKDLYNETDPNIPISFADEEMLFIQRSDSRIFSIRNEFYSYSGGAHPMYGAFGYNFDTQTGKMLELTDVVTDFHKILDLAEQKLYDIYDKEMFYNDVEDIFENLTPQDLNWTMGYQGITFHFIPYTLGPYAAGMQEVTIWFNEAPELFVEKYSQVPAEGYAVSIPLGREYEFDKSVSDGWADLICISAESSNGYAFDKLSISLNESLYEDTEICLTEASAYLVCSGEAGKSNYYLYIYGALEDGHKIYIYDLNQNSVQRCALEENVFFQGDWFTDVEEFEVYYEPVLTDPTAFTMHSKMSAMGLFLGEKVYSVDPNSGVMQSEKNSYTIPDYTWPITSKVPLELEYLADGEIVEFPAGSIFFYKRTDGSSYVDVLSDGGTEYRIEVDTTSDYTRINGMSVEECFDGVTNIW